MKKLCILIVLLLLMTSLFGCTPDGSETKPSTSPTTTLPVRTTTAPQTYVGNAMDPIQWDLTVTRVTGTGQVLDGQFAFTVAGEFRDASDHHIALDIEISLADHLPYTIRKPDDGCIASKVLFREYGYYSSSSFYLVNHSSDVSVMHFAIDPVNGFAIFFFENGTDHYYVGSVDPFVDPAEIYARFSEFVETHHLN